MSLSKLILRFFSKNSFYILLILILTINFVFKINFIRDLSDNDDVNKEYLVANHIVKYQEYPLAGPWSSVTGDIKHNPLYFYFLSLFLFINNDLKFLVIINIILQMITILIIYFLAKELFDEKVGLMVVIIFGFSILTLEHVSYVWQPYIMQPFVNLSYLLLLIGYKKRKYLLLLVSVFVFIFSTAMHISVFTLAPIFIGILIWNLKKKKYSLIYYFGVGVTFLFSLLIFYLPLLIYLIKNQVNVFTSPSSFSLLSLPIILSQFWSNLIFFVGITISNMSLINETVSYIAFSIVVIFSVYYFLFTKNVTRKKITLILLCIVGYLIFSISLLDFNKYSHHLYYYLTPVFGLFTIVFAEFITKEFSKNNYIKTINFSVVLIYLILFIRSYNIFLEKSDKPSIFDKYSAINPALEILLNEITFLKDTNGYKDFSFFRIETDRENNGWKFIPSYMIALEKALNTKLTENSDLEIMSFRQINNPSSRYIFLICNFLDTQKTNETCKDNFLKDRKEYYLIKSIYSDQHKNINLFKRG